MEIDREKAVRQAIEHGVRIAIPCSNEALADRCLKDYCRFVPRTGWTIRKKLSEIETLNPPSMWIVIIEPVTQ